MLDNLPNTISYLDCSNNKLNLRDSSLPRVKESLSKKNSDGEYKINLKKQILDEITNVVFDRKFIKINYNHKEKYL